MTGKKFRRKKKERETFSSYLWYARVEFFQRGKIQRFVQRYKWFRRVTASSCSQTPEHSSRLFLLHRFMGCGGGGDAGRCAPCPISSWQNLVLEHSNIYAILRVIGRLGTYQIPQQFRGRPCPPLRSPLLVRRGDALLFPIFPSSSAPSSCSSRRAASPPPDPIRAALPRELSRRRRGGRTPAQSRGPGTRPATGPAPSSPPVPPCSASSWRTDLKMGT